MHLILILGFVVFALIAFYLSHLKLQKRRQELFQLAIELGWQFDPGHDSTLESRYPQFSLFQRGHSRYAYHTIRGHMMIDSKRSPVVLGDYHYRETSGSGKNRSTRTYRLSYLIVEMPFLRSCDLRVRKEGLFDRLAGMIGFDDIDFESAEFSDQFHVKSSDKKLAYDVLHPRMMEFLLDGDPPEIDIARRACCLSTGKKCWTPQEFKQTLQWVDEFFQHWPGYVTASLSMESPTLGN